MDDNALRKHLVDLLRGGGAHVMFDDAIKGLPADLRGKCPKGAAHSAWQLVEHMRIAQWDMLEFCRNPEHKSPPWPDGYWPKSPVPPNASAWTKSVKAFRSDLEAMCDLVANPGTNLFVPVPGGDGQTVLREALLVADHNAYHLGALVTLRQQLGAWKR